MTVSNVLNAAVSFPAVVFTVTSIFFVGFWAVTTALGAGFDAVGEFDIDPGQDIDVDADATVGPLRSTLEFLGIAGMPLVLALSIMSISAWAVAMVGQLIVGDEGSVGFLLGLGVLVLALAIARITTRRLGRMLHRTLAPTPALRRQHFVGRTCIITTQRVTSDFGQAEVRDSEGGSLIIQIRSDEANDLAQGDSALLFDLDEQTGFYQVMENPELDT